MNHRKGGVLCAWLVWTAVVAAPYAGAGTTRIAIFKGMELPCDLKCGNEVIKQGKYDCEVHFSKVDTNLLYIIRLLKKGQYVHEIPGQPIEYQAQTLQDLAKDPKIPDKPTIRFRKLPESPIFDIIFESGKTGNFRYMKAFFRTEQVQE